MNHDCYVIGCIANYPDQYYIARDLITADDFIDDACRTIWNAMGKVRHKHLPITRNTISKEIGENYAEIFDLFANQVYSRTVEPFCNGLINDNKHEHLKRAIATALEQDEPAKYLQDAIDKFNSVGTNQSLSFQQLISHTVAFIENVSDGETGIQTGLKCIDQRIGGLQKDRIFVIAARTRVGKTALSMQIALHVAASGTGVGICSLEMGAHELGIRSLAHACKSNISGLYRADNVALDLMSQVMSATKLADWPMYFNTEQYMLNEIINQIRVWKKKDNIQLAVVDHIGLVEVKEAKSANERLGLVTRAMKKLSKELHIPIILVSQLNRSNDKENRKPRLSDLRDSGSIEQDADIVLLMHKQTDNLGVYLRHELALPKNRQGATEAINDTDIRFVGETQTFIENTRI